MDLVLKIDIDIAKADACERLSAKEIERQPPPVETHADADFLASRGGEPVLDPGEAERIKQLRALGYIGGEDD